MDNNVEEGADGQPDQRGGNGKQDVGRHRGGRGREQANAEGAAAPRLHEVGSLRRPSFGARSDHLTHLEDRQVDRDDEAANDDAEHDHDDRFDQAGQRIDGVVDFALVVVGDFGQHGIERA